MNGTKISGKKLIENICYNKFFWIGLIIIGFLIRIYLLPHESGDYRTFLSKWVDFIKTHGYFNALQYTFSNYTPTYTYVLCIIAKLGLNPLLAIKAVSIFFDYVLAFFVAKILFMKYKNNIVYWVCFALVPLIPTVFLNSAWWGQCDSIYTSFILGSLYFIFKKKQFLSILFLGIAFALKLQTIFIFPFYFILLLRGNVKWYYFALIPAVYFISIVPAWLYGRPLLNLLTIYLHQTGAYPVLALGFTNGWFLIKEIIHNNMGISDAIRLIGVILDFCLVLFLCVFFSRKRYKFNFETYLQLSFLCSIIMPYILPSMHDRYMFCGDILAFVYFAIFSPKRYFALGIIIVSMYGYLYYGYIYAGYLYYGYADVYLIRLIVAIVSFLLFTFVIVRASILFYNNITNASKNPQL